MERKSKAYSFNMFQNLNTRVMLFGMPPLYLVGGFVLCVLSGFFFGYLAVIPLIGVTLLIRSVSKEYKDGDPDPIDSYFLESKQPDHISDEIGILKYLKRK